MGLDPQARRVLDLLAAAGRPGPHMVPAPEARRLYRETRGPLQAAAPEVASVADRTIPGPGGPLTLRLYRPLGSRAAEALPALLYFHGGGWTIGDIETHDTLCRMLANSAGCAVVSVDYRLAPEHKFPAAPDDCWAATRWALGEGAAHGIDTARIAVGGDSAGGNLAAVTALTARDRGERLACQLLLYPQTDLVADAPSHLLFGEGYGLTSAAIAYFIANYIAGAAEATHWRVSPQHAADVSGVAPAFLLTAGFDPLRDEGRAYAARLALAGVPLRFTEYEGMIHGFFGMGRMIDAMPRAVAEAGAALAAAFAR
ncbi:MAG: alpha/beta hydrolase [Alphaproteobacteria bacterium]|nr:alpha/beta hydrolase [Alphaproteobacteria bacterium]